MQEGVEEIVPLLTHLFVETSCGINPFLRLWRKFVRTIRRIYPLQAEMQEKQTEGG